MTTDLSGFITDVNKQMESLTDCTRDELIGAPFKNYFTDPERAEASIRLALIEKKVTNYELTARARDGKETVVSFNAMTFYDRDRRLQGVFAAARDVTERKRLEEALWVRNTELEVARSVAEKANLAKSDFLSSMSHELRTPLNAIIGFAQLMESDSPAPTSEQKESIAQILKAGWHLLKLINEVLDLAKVESGNMALSLEPVSLTEVMLECQDMVEPQAQKHGIRMIFPKLDIPYYVMADLTKLNQVLINLLSNAIKYNLPNETVEVSYSENGPGRIRLFVRDHGAGLPPEKIAQLFQPFNRLGQEASGTEGTGIGLVIAKQLVELMGGAIGVESTVGAGSTFWFEMNLVAAPQNFTKDDGAPEFEEPRMTLGTQQHTILYVEDNQTNMNLVTQIVSRITNIQMLSAVNGNSGIEIALKYIPDIIILDINLPDISGFEVLKFLQLNRSTMHIPIIALSANAMPRDIMKGIKAGFFRYLTKPLIINEFTDALSAALEFTAQKIDKGK